jgi:hypothetical protein
MKQTVGTLSARYEPKERLVIVPSVRFENIDWSNHVHFEETNVGSGAARPAIVEAVGAESDKDWKVVSESLEVRYAGKKNVSLNFKGEWSWSKSEGNLTEERILEPGTSHAAISIDRDTEFERDTQKYAATANWYVRPGTTVAVQYYYKTRANDYRSTTRDNTVSTGDRYPAYIANQDFETNDFNVRLSTKLGPRLRSVTRYDYQETTINTQDIGLAFAESAEMTTHVLAQAVTWPVVCAGHGQPRMGHAPHARRHRHRQRRQPGQEQRRQLHLLQPRRRLRPRRRQRPLRGLHLLRVERQLGGQFQPSGLRLRIHHALGRRHLDAQA